MYLHDEDAIALASEITENYGASEGIAVFPSAEVLTSVFHVVDGSEVLLGAQDCHFESQGAHTGEISAVNLSELGCQYVLVGHSERRAAGETDMVVHKKMLAALAAGLTPVLCVGENKEQRSAGEAKEVTRAQIEAATVDVPSESYMVAYEPVWAIGTGDAATSTDAEAMCAFVKEVVGDWCAVLYGGSVSAENIQQYIDQQNIDGFLVGGASTSAAKLFPMLDLLS